MLATLRANAHLLAGPAGEALRGLFSDALRGQARTAELRPYSHGSGRTAMREITRRAVARGEIDAGAVTPRRLDVAQAMLRQQFLFHGPPIPGHVIVEIVDEVIVPLFATPAARPGSSSA